MPSSILNLKFKGNKSFVAFSNLGDSDSLTKTWKVCTKVASYLEQGQRLENLSWRLWHLQNLIVDTDNAKSKREFKKLSKVMGDKLDKEKGRAIEELAAPDFKLNPNAEKLRQRAEEKERSRYESATHASGRPLKRMQFTFSVDQPAGTFSEAPGPLSGVRKPDLKPSSQFKDTVHRRRPATRASANANAASSLDSAGMDMGMEDPPSLTHIGRKPSPPPAEFSSPDITSPGLPSAYGNWSSGGETDASSAAALRFPTLFTSDFGPSALLFPQPSLVNPLSYGEDTSPVRDRESFQITRPTIELPLDEILKDMARSERRWAHEPDSPGAWGNSSEDEEEDEEDVEMQAIAPPQPRERERLPRTVHPAQVNASSAMTTTTTPTPSAGRAKPSLTVRTSSASARGSASASAGRNANANTNTNNNNSETGTGGSTAPGGVKAECSNCGATHTPLWRRGLNDELNCNACGLYCKLHKRPRPKSMRSQNGEGRGSQSTPRNESADTVGEPAQCYNCHTMATPLWRKDDEGKTVCNACGLYFKLHGSSRPISMKSDIIRKRSRHDARRVGSGETPSASPGASRRASPSSGGSGGRRSPTLAPDSSTAQPAYSFSPEDYDFGAGGANGGGEYGAGNLSLGGSGLFGPSSHFDAGSLMFQPTSSPFPGPYHPDYLQRSYATSGGNLFGEDARGVVAEEEDRMSKRRRMSIDSVSEPPSSTASYSSYATETSSATTASRSSLDFNIGFGTASGAGAGSATYAYPSFGTSGAQTLRAQGAFWHPPMLPQPADKSPGCFVHPPMLPSDDTTTGTTGNAFGGGAGSKDFPMDFLHPPMIPGGNASGGREEDRDLFASYLHPPMVLSGDDSPLAPLSSLHPHPPMLPSGESYYSHQQHQQQHHQQQQQDLHNGYGTQQQLEDTYHRLSDSDAARSYHHQQQRAEREQEQQFYEHYGLVGFNTSGNDAHMDMSADTDTDAGGSGAKRSYRTWSKEF